MRIVGGSPTIMNTIFIGNHAGNSDGGIFNDSGSPTITNTIFIGNSAIGDESAGGDGQRPHQPLRSAQTI